GARGGGCGAGGAGGRGGRRVAAAGRGAAWLGLGGGAAAAPAAAAPFGPRGVIPLVAISPPSRRDGRSGAAAGVDPAAALDRRAVVYSYSAPGLGPTGEIVIPRRIFRVRITSPAGDEWSARGPQDGGPRGRRAAARPG